MQVIPAIDLRHGRCVRLLQGDYERETVFPGDPVEYAERWAAEGASWLHVVDLDGARTGRPSPINMTMLRRIVEAVPMKVEMGGGVRSLAAAEDILALGVERVVVGTAIATDTEAASVLFSTLGARVVAGVDARDGLVAVEGWQRSVTRTADDFARKMAGLGAKRLIYTDIARDGMLSGPNGDALRRLASAVSIPVIASGGVGSIEDLIALRALDIANLEGVIIGRALYSGDLTVRSALHVLQDRES